MLKAWKLRDFCMADISLWLQNYFCCIMQLCLRKDGLSESLTKLKQTPCVHIHNAMLSTTELRLTQDIYLMGVKSIAERCCCTLSFPEC